MEEKCCGVGANRFVKTNVRLFRAEDVIWMTLDKEARENDWVALCINADGFYLSIKPSAKSVVATWKSVAADLGFESCEYVLNPDGTKCVLLYDSVPLSNDCESPTRS